jgi:hypothetical protein
MIQRSWQKLFKKKTGRIEPESGAYSGNGILDTEIRQRSFDLPDRSELDVLRGARVELPDIGPNHFSAIEPEPQPSLINKIRGAVFGLLGFEVEYRRAKSEPKRRDK